MKARIFILLCIMLLHSIVMEVQEASKPVTVNIAVGEEFPPSVIGGLEDNLLQHGVSLQQVEQGDENGLISLYKSGGDYAPWTFYVFLAQIIPFDLTQSPLLRESYNEIISDTVGLDLHTSYLTGVILYMLGRCDEALPYFDSLNHIPDEYDQPVESIYTRNSPAFFRGVCAIDRGDIEDAIPLFEQVAYRNGYSSRPEPTPGLINLAWAYLQVDRDEEAFALLDDYVDYVVGPLDQPLAVPNLNRRDVIVMRAKFHALNADFDTALGDTETAIALVKKHSPGDSHGLAKLYLEQGQIRLLTYEWDAVLEDYNTAIELAPNQAEAYYRRGLLYYTTLVDRENALPDFERYLELYPDGPFAVDAAQYIADITAELEALEK